MKRFILTKGNKIIDTNKYDIKREKHLNGNIFLYEKNEHEKLVFLIKPSRIIKEADNLIKLIEKRDLVEYKMENNEYSEMLKINPDEYSKFVLAGLAVDDLILAVYKPNKNKGYDLVWEAEKQ